MSAAILEARKKAEKAAAAALSTPKKVAAENCSSSIGSRVTPKRSLESAGAGDGSIASVSPYTPKPGRPATGVGGNGLCDPREHLMSRIVYFIQTIRSCTCYPHDSRV